ncbi:hypothetical protein FRX31_017961, partial [Thalictrum thalictroides]
MGDMNNPANLEQNFTRLLAKKVDLDDLKHQVEKRSKRYREGEDGLLHNIEDKQHKIEEIQSKLNEIKMRGFQFNNVNDRYQLNKKECGISEKDKIKARILAKVALWCIQSKPKVRPAMSTVVKMLEMEIPVKNQIPNPFPKPSNH